jgi:predicted enzyme related to lactoylglutathione lyase
MKETHQVTGSLINIDVPDIRKAEAFYCGVFGLQLLRRLGPSAVELSGLGVPCFLLQKTEGTAAFREGHHKRNYNRHWTPVHLDITVSDIHSVYERALAAGARAESEIRLAPYGMIAVMADPFGHGFCLIEFNEKGYDALAT